VIGWSAQPSADGLQKAKAVGTLPMVTAATPPA